MDLTHVNKQGNAKMVDVTDKYITKRNAIASATVIMKPETLKRILNGGIKKGDVLQVAQVAGIMACKNTSNLIPMCHPLPLSSINIEYSHDLEKGELYIKANVSVEAKTGVEMESLTAVSVTALTIYDMCKAIDKDMVITDVKLLEKTGGKSTYRRKL